MTFQCAIRNNISRWSETRSGYYHEIVSNKAKGRISKRVFHENKAHQIF